VCIPPQALLAGVLRRMRDEGYVPPDAELRALLGAGVRPTDPPEGHPLRERLAALTPLPRR